MTSPDITISNHRLRWAVDGMRFTAPLPEEKKKKKRRGFMSIQMLHTHTPGRKRVNPEKGKRRNNKIIKGGLTSILKSRALLPAGKVVKSSRMGINSCSNSNELGAQHVQPHQKTKNEGNTKPASMDLPEEFFM